MATASRQVRKIRRIKRERTLAYRGMDLAISQRDTARMVAVALEKELKKYTDDPFPEDAPAPASTATTVQPTERVVVTKIGSEETTDTNG